MDYPIETRRHSAAHLMAAAIKRLFPEAKFGVGPAIENGFYYDIDIGRPVSTDDLEAIDKEMQAIKKQNPAFTREELDIDDAISLFKEMGQPYKVELLTDLKTKGTTSVSAEEAQDIDPQNVGMVTLYRTGEFADLCRGPHVTEAKEVGVWKLHKVAGAYWRGKAENPQMQRIYGLCFATKDELKAYEAMLAEAEKRDHRKLGKELGLFVFSELVGPGLPLWTPRGTIIREALNDFVESLRKPYGYERVAIPHITKKDLYETSGHWAKYADDLFKIKTREDHLYAMKPMNCPHHAQIYASEQRSYRQLPVRYAETTMVYRDEQSGELSGLSRVLSITQDDAHVFCRVSQIREEAEKVWDIIQRFYTTFGFQLTPRLSRRDPAKSEKYIGRDEDWNQSEAALQQMLEDKNVDWIEGIGEAAFYGPKIDFMAKDSIGRTWQVATIQLDYNQPKNFGLSCVNEDGEHEGIVMIHCAIMGSIERFMSVLIEHYAGVFPLWLSPVQVAVLPVADRHNEFAHALATELSGYGLRVHVDDSAESVGKKIRNAEKTKVPRMLVVGDKESDGGPLTVRVRGEAEQQTMEKPDFIKETLEQIRNRLA
ncbi:threonine--tRNA ligase [Candidatus Uhrbacteria bacterium]|nr:threonine--tRNA ligase [Candidatus Uhrbacteria bacterium]